jgi:hypothetical protein
MADNIDIYLIAIESIKKRNYKKAIEVNKKLESQDNTFISIDDVDRS